MARTQYTVAQQSKILVIFLFLQADVVFQYDRTDPAEIQSLKDEIELLKTQKAEAEKLAAEREEQLNNLQSRVHIFFENSDEITFLTTVRRSSLLRKT